MGKRKCTFNPELQQLFPFLEKHEHNGDEKSGVYCQICDKTFSIANGGKSQIHAHLRTQIHKEGVLRKSFEKEAEDDNFSKDENSGNLPPISTPFSIPSLPEIEESPLQRKDIDKTVVPEEGLSLCMLCCYSFSSLPPDPQGQSPRMRAFVDKFLRQTHSSLSSSRLMGVSSGVSLCGECLSSMAKAALRRDQADQLGLMVRGLQQEISRLLNEIKQIMTGYKEEMRELERKISESDKTSLKKRCAKNGYRMKQISQFRDGIMNVTKKLDADAGPVPSEVDHIKEEIPDYPNDDSDNDNISLDDGRATISPSIRTTNAPRKPIGSRIRPPPKIWASERCGKQLKSSYALKVHSETHLNYRRYLCSECPKAFKARSSWWAHKRIHDQNHPVLKCEICTKIYRDRKTFEGHLKVHQGEGFTCEHCGTMVATQRLLQHHQKSHLKDTWSCDRCKATFVNQRKWERHQKLHEEGKREFRCETCDKVFHSRKYLRIHRKMHLPDKAYRCETCRIRFNLPTSLYMHTRRVHHGKTSDIQTHQQSSLYS